MMLLTTLVPTVFILGIAYFVVVRRIPWPWLSYGLVVALSIGCFLAGSVHFQLMGVEVLALGVILVACHYRWWRVSAGQRPAA